MTTQSTRRILTVGAICITLFAPMTWSKDYEFIRGDCDGDSVTNIADVITWLNTWGACPAVCQDARDFNDDGAVNIGDPIFLLNVLFAGGGPIAAPVGAIGCDGTPADGLPCASPSSGSTNPLACP